MIVLGEKIALLLMFFSKSRRFFVLLESGRGRVVRAKS